METKIEECRESGVTIDQWCELNNVSKYALKYHMYHKKVKADDGEPDTISFVPLKVETTHIVSSSINLFIRNDIHLSIDNDTDLDLVKKIVEVLL